MCRPAIPADFYIVMCQDASAWKSLALVRHTELSANFSD